MNIIKKIYCRAFQICFRIALPVLPYSDSSKMEAFLIPAGTTIEVYATTLHYAPCNVAASGFKCVVVLPKGTNTDITLEEKHTPEDDLLFARNKWLLSHPDANIAGSVAGIKGENLSVK